MKVLAKGLLGAFALLPFHTNAQTTLEEALIRRAPSFEVMTQSISAEERLVLHQDLLLIAADILCPTDTKRAEISALNIQQARFQKLLNGSSVADIRRLAAQVSAAQEAERKSMRVLPVGSEQEQAIRKAVDRYYEAATDSKTDSYALLFRFWTAARIAFAQQVQTARGQGLNSLLGPGHAAQPGSDEREHARRRAWYVGEEFLRTFKVSTIVANDQKAYVNLRRDSTELRAFSLREEGGTWKVHADLFGYPWSMEDSSPPECAGVLSE